jgi:DNA ligase-1
VKSFAQLLDRLSYSPSRNAKIRLMQEYFRATPDPDRGWALAALTDGLPFSFPLRRTLTDMMAQRMDSKLFALSRDYVGDTAETIALVWPEPRGAVEVPLRLADVVSELALVGRNDLGPRVERWLDRLDATGRWALLKLMTGALRVGVSARLARTAVAGLAGIKVDDVEEVWHALTPPYVALFDWIEGRAPKPNTDNVPVFRPLMLSHALDDADWAALDLAEFAAEWKWDGIRVQLVATESEARLFSRTGDDIGRAFPDVIEGMRFNAVVDGELLVMRGGEVAPFNDLQQRLNRKTVSKKQMETYPAHIRLYDILMLEGEDLRGLPFVQRRTQLEDWHARVGPARTDLSEVIPEMEKEALYRLWSDIRAASIEGLMLKRRQSRYVAGRPKGEWYKWKRAPLTLDCVLMYAQRGSGKRSSYYSDYTFGAWRANPETGTEELVPVGKAYFGFTDAALLQIDRWVRAHTTESFGPVRSVTPELVFEVAFDAVQKSTRHKSGVAMRFPRISRIRWDKPAAEADRVETLMAMIEA